MRCLLARTQALSLRVCAALLFCSTTPSAKQPMITAHFRVFEPGLVLSVVEFALLLVDAQLSLARSLLLGLFNAVRAAFVGLMKSAGYTPTFCGGRRVNLWIFHFPLGVAVEITGLCFVRLFYPSYFPAQTVL